MLDRNPRDVPTRPPEQPSASREIGLTDLISFWKRQRLPMILTTALVGMIGAVYLASSTAQYTATTSLLIDTRKLAIFGEGDVLGESAISNANLETQIQILLSGRISEAVARELNLASDADFMTPSSSLIEAIWESATSLMRGDRPAPATEPTEDALVARAGSILRSNLRVQRVGLSYVINVSYTSKDRYAAAKIANAYTVAYVADLLNAQLEYAQRGSDWLLGRIRDLRERAADETLAPQEKSAVRTTYDSLLQRYTELVQQQSLPSADARVITPALAGSKTSPNLPMGIAASLIVGGALGFGIGLARDLLDHAVRTRQQVEAAGAAFLGYLPNFDLGRLEKRAARRARKKIVPGTREFSVDATYSITLTSPFSPFTETLRTIKLAAERIAGGSAIVLGVTSALPREGKTTIATNLAQLIAQSGDRVLLIDGDFRTNGLTRSITALETPGLVQVAQRRTQFDDVVWSDHATGLNFLPTGASGMLGGANEVLSSETTEAFLGACRREYKVVIVDLPAILPVVDARAAAPLLDGLIFVVEWGVTTPSVLAQAFQTDGVSDKVFGAVLNKVKLKALSRY